MSPKFIQKIWTIKNATMTHIRRDTFVKTKLEEEPILDQNLVLDSKKKDTIMSSLCEQPLVNMRKRTI